MTKDELTNLKAWLETEIDRRRRLGGYNSDSESILCLFITVHKIASHLKPDKPKAKKK